MNNTTALGTESIAKLFRKMTIPAVTAQVISLLYNIVDRIYIGHMGGIGTAALTGIGLFAPILTLINSFAMLIASGGSPLLSTELGKGNKDRAEQILGTCAAALIVLSVILTAGLFAAAPALLKYFGASEASFPYADAYSKIYIWGIPFTMITLGLNLFISGQGYSKISMLTTLIGAVVNIILDPVLIYNFRMGVEGAAIATVIAQAVSAVWILFFLCGEKTTVRLRHKYLKIRRKILLPCLGLGVSSFVMMSTESLLSIAFTRSLAVFGGDIAVGSMTIISSISTVLHFPVNGFAQGCNPIISYNFGFRRNDRIKQAFSILLKTCIVYTTVIWFIILLFPKTVAGLFTTDEAMVYYCSRVMRIYFAVAITNAFQTCCQNSFVSLGQSKIALFMACLRKLILLIPLILILPRVFPGDPVFLVFLAEPVSDLIAALACSVTFFRRFDSILENGPIS